MKLFTKDIDKKLFAQYSKGADLENQTVVAKIFNPYGRGAWYILNSDPEDPDYLWAIVDLFEVETGSVSRSELESIKVPPFGLHLERDMYFTPVNAAKLYKQLYLKAEDEMTGESEGERRAGMDEYKDGGETGYTNKSMLENQVETMEHHVEELEQAVKKTDKVEAWVLAKAERAVTDLQDITHYLDSENEIKREEKEGEEEEEEYAQGGEVKWQDADFGDSALVVSENKMGIIMKPYGRKFHLKFVDGTEKTYDASELKFFKDMDEFDRGGYMANGGGTSSPNIEFMKWFIDWSKSVNKHIYVSMSIPNEFSSPIKGDNGKIVILDLIEKKGDADAKKYMNEILKKADEFGVSIYLEPIPRTHNLKSQEHKKKITKDYLIKYYEKLGFEKTDGGFMVRAPKMAEGGEIKKGDFVMVDNPHWKASMGVDKPVKRKVTFVDSEIVFFADGSNSSLQYVKKMAEGGKMGMGGKVKFKDKVEAIKASLLKRKKVPKVVQKDYGKTFSPAEAEDSAKRIVGAQTARERLMMRIKSKKKK